jgi:hypothetical protein
MVLPRARDRAAGATPLDGRFFSSFFGKDLY